MNKLVLIFSFIAILSCQAKEKRKIVQPVPTPPSETNTYRKIKFTDPINFEKYRVDTVAGKPAPINYSSNPTAKLFRTVIKWAIANFGMNFGGHYNIARWGCGTSCQSGAITDLETGNVFDIPAASGGYQFRKDSKLLVVNPPDSTGYYDDCDYCVPELWIWNESKKKFEKIN